ncbi:flavin reductase family protein [Mycoplasmatota bacterium]|nr:flavin reductase family protein [Mycoplasmatota bacterium]
MKRKIKNYPLLHPVPIVLACAKKEKKINVTTIGDVAIMGLNPPLIVLSTNEKHLITDFVDEVKILSLNIPQEKLLKKVDYCGIYSGRDVDKENLFTYEYHDEIPSIKECNISLNLKVIERVQIKQRVIYITEVTGTFVDEFLLDNDKLSLSKMKSVLYGLDNSYYSVGDIIGKGYSIGKELK